jgi:hypothetical protein
MRGVCKGLQTVLGIWPQGKRIAVHDPPNQPVMEPKSYGLTRDSKLSIVVDIAAKRKYPCAV